MPHIGGRAWRRQGGATWQSCRQRGQIPRIFRHGKLIQQGGHAAGHEGLQRRRRTAQHGMEMAQNGFHAGQIGFLQSPRRLRGDIAIGGAHHAKHFFSGQMEGLVFDMLAHQAGHGGKRIQQGHVITNR